MSKVHIHLSRKITLSRAGHPDVSLDRGHNFVDADVADHPFVKAHTVETRESDANDDALAALRAELAAEKQRADDAERQAAAEKQRADELAAVLEAMSAEADKGGKGGARK